MMTLTECRGIKYTKILQAITGWSDAVRHKVNGGEGQQRVLDQQTAGRSRVNSALRWMAIGKLLEDFNNKLILLQ